MSKTFRYRSFSKPDEKDPYPAAPRIPIILRGPKEAFENMGIIDSGATNTILPLFVAEILGLKLKDKTEVKFVEGIGSGFESKVEIIIEMEHEKKITLEVPCIILDNADEIILGRAGFFDHFDITFKEYRKEIILKYIGEIVKNRMKR